MCSFIYFHQNIVFFVRISQTFYRHYLIHKCVLDVGSDIKLVTNKYRLLLYYDWLALHFDG